MRLTVARHAESFTHHHGVQVPPDRREPVRSCARRARHPGDASHRAIGEALCQLRGVKCVLGNVDTQNSVSFSSDPRSNGSASINLVHRICARTRPRIPSSLNSGALKSGAESTDRAWSPKGHRRLTAFLASGRNDHLPDARNVQGTAVQRLCRYSDCRLFRR
jgi:hypothetical protein